MGNQLVVLRFITIKNEDSIVLIAYRKGLSIDLEVAKEIVKERLNFFDGENYPVLIDGRHVKLLTQGARDYFSSEIGMKGVKALAILPGRYLTVVMAKLFMKFKPKIPMKIFRTKEQALKWLRQFTSQTIVL
jgi:hypothetical protein